MPNLMIANPPRRRRRSGKRRTARVSRAIATRVASIPYFARSSSRRRRVRRAVGLGLRAGGGLVGSTKNTAISGAVATAGYIIADKLIDKIPVDQLKVGKGRALGKLLIGVGMALIAKRVAPRFANDLATGAAVNAGLDLYTSMKAGITPAPAAGLGFGQPAGVEYGRGLMGGRLGNAAYSYN